ncbi:acetoacetate--CoA ligase [Spirosoma litoris]
MPHPTLSPLYTPDRRTTSQSLMKRYMDWLFIKKGLYFRDYDDLWDWSVTDLEDFWESIWQFFDVQSHTPYHQVVFRPNRVDMIGTEWFTGATLNYAEHIFRHKPIQTRGERTPALLFASERHSLTSVSWESLEHQVVAVATHLRQQGVGVGDRVVAMLPNIPEAIVAFLATTSIGAVWSSCSPDFSTASVLDRFQELSPKALFVVDGYSHHGELIDNTDTISELCRRLPTLKTLIWIPYLDNTSKFTGRTATNVILWHEVLAIETPDELVFEPVPFDHPLWILYTSGTTGKPKAIAQSVGGCLLEHLKALALHQDVRVGDRYFWHTNPGSMMWNFAIGSMLTGTTLVLYDGVASYPTLNVLWQLAEEARINHFGNEAIYYMACQRADLTPINTSKLTYLRTVSSTGSILPPEGFRWIYESVKPTIWLTALSEATDICSSFVGGNPLLPVYEGEIQCRWLGSKVEAVDEQAKPVRGKLGEMVVMEPMPSMPIYLWNDPTNSRYQTSYFEEYPGNFWAGDYIQITERNGILIHGHADATLERQGVRIGTSEIYNAVERFAEIADSLIVGLDQPGKGYFMPLFVVMKNGVPLTNELIKRIKLALQTQLSVHHVPDAVYPISEVPYTITGKKLETSVRKILSGMDISLATNKDTLRNPASLRQFAEFVK